jgi:LmbE family N-acetylglucosaminyl deacetylase
MSLWSHCPRALKPHIRRGLRFFVLWRLRFNSRLLAPAGPGTVTLIIAPHQDDCALGCAGVILRRVSTGNPVFIAYLTDGSASHRGHPSVLPSELARMRADEAYASASVLGVSKENLTFFGAPDGELNRLGYDVREDLMRRLSRHVIETGATEIFVTSAGDGSTEHEAANAIVVAALGLLGAAIPTVLEYPIWALWSPLRLVELMKEARVTRRQALTGPELKRKSAAIRSFQSQLCPLGPWKDAALPKGFAKSFEGHDEFFFERTLSVAKFLG